MLPLRGLAYAPFDVRCLSNGGPAVSLGLQCVGLDIEQVLNRHGGGGIAR